MRAVSGAKAFSSAMMLLVVLMVAGGTSAMATVLWTVNDVTFSDGNTLTGTFTTDSGITTFLDIDLTVTGPNSAADFTVDHGDTAYLPGGLSLFNITSTQYVDLVLASPLTGAGGTIAFTSGNDCPNCGTLVVNGDTEVTGVVIAPEPSAILLLPGGLILLGIASRLRWIRAS
jgi:hypothetical protein